MASTCAFLVAAVEILAFALVVFQREVTLRSFEDPPIFASVFIYLGIAIALIGAAAQGMCLWEVGRRQKVVAPTTSRLGQLAVATYVVVVFLTTILSSIVPFVVELRWPSYLPGFFLSFALGCLGVAAHGGRSSWQRWASLGLLFTALTGVLTLAWRLFGLQSGPGPLWFAMAILLMRVATWIALGVWLRVQAEQAITAT